MIGCRSSLATLMLGLMAVASCGEAPSDAACPEGTLRAGEVCILDQGGDNPNNDVPPNNQPNNDVNNDQNNDVNNDQNNQPNNDPNNNPNNNPNNDTPPPLPDALPVTVDDVYVPSGYMGDGQQPNNIVEEITCNDPRPGGGLGQCHKFTFTPGAMGWGGVFWQYPEGNWGTADGFAMPAGATTLRFYAWGQNGAEVVKFLVGIGDADGFALETTELELTTTPTQYTLDLSSVDYQDVAGGFGWVAGGVDQPPLVFFIDDIVWE